MNKVKTIVALTTVLSLSVFACSKKKDPAPQTSSINTLTITHKATKKTVTLHFDSTYTEYNSTYKEYYLFGTNKAGTPIARFEMNSNTNTPSSRTDSLTNGGSSINIGMGTYFFNGDTTYQSTPVLNDQHEATGEYSGEIVWDTDGDYIIAKANNVNLYCSTSDTTSYNSHSVSGTLRVKK